MAVILFKSLLCILLYVATYVVGAVFLAPFIFDGLKHTLLSGLCWGAIFFALQFLSYRNNKDLMVYAAKLNAPKQ